MPMVPKSNVVPLPRGPSLPPVDPTFAAMAAATMHEMGRLFEPEQPQVEQVANKGPQGTVPVIPIMRSDAALQRALREAEGDDDLRAIRDRMRRRGMDTNIPQFEGLK